MIKIESKLCSICNTDKLLTEYYSTNKVKKDGTKYIYYHPECKECTRRKANEWNANNPERAYNTQAKYRTTEKYKSGMERRNKGRLKKELQKQWRERNKDKLKEYNNYREMNKKHEITDEEWENCKNYFNYRCAYCGLAIENHYNLFYGEMKWFDFHKEHVEHEGSNKLDNCVPSCKSCNSQKRQFELEFWYNKENEKFTQERLDKIHRWLENDYNLFIK